MLMKMAFLYTGRDGDPIPARKLIRIILGRWVNFNKTSTNFVIILTFLTKSAVCRNSVNCFWDISFYVKHYINLLLLLSLSFIIIIIFILIMIFMITGYYYHYCYEYCYIYFYCYYYCYYYYYFYNCYH